MENLYDIIFSKYELFLLIFVRATGLFIISPIFSKESVPSVIKIGFAFLFSILLINVIDYEVVDTNGVLVILIINELLVGLIIGFISYIFFTALYLTGQIVSMQIGFGMVNVMDPQSNVQIPVMGNFYYIIALLIFLLINGHHMLIEALVSSYELLPIGYSIFQLEILDQMIRIFGQVFIIGFKISSPILATIILADVLLGVLARTMPQMNVFIVGMPLKIMVGIVAVIVMMPLFIIALQHIFTNMYEEIFNFIKVLKKG